ncbi:T9SS type A sorting domain-containing protein [Rufibacter sp. H-1]|uniref:T9SS type A sorting domain-containing protein n=1 Tax=Rufibacter sediminis TaxID=2762756 RepID=A0ABR6VX82_9BACT|nr:T9SS type A sorting domain-containing protein [Rufibacter sediminis]
MYGSTSPSISATVPNGQTINWYDAPSGGTLLASGSSYSPPARTDVGTNTYYAEAQLGNCRSNSRTAVTLTITQKPLTITGVSAVTRPYNGTMVTTLTGTPVLNGKLENDAITIDPSTAVATFASKMAGANKPVTVTGYTLSGAASLNYNLAQPTGLTATITPLEIEGYITVADKPYDGNTTAMITSHNLTGILSPDDVSYTGGTATFNDKNVGNGKTVTATGLSLTGADARNYSVNTTATATASITAQPLTVTATAQSREYDGSTSATVTLTTNKVDGDNVTAASSSAEFSDPNVGVGKTVTVTGITLNGSDAGNYTLANTTAITTASITARALTLTGVSVEDKVYDATTRATLQGTPSLTGTLENDEVSLDPASEASASFNTKTVGEDKPVTITGYTLTGAHAGNYTLAPNLTADITPLAITGAITAADKTYDGNASATITSRSLVGVLDDDAVTYTGGTATFSDKNVGRDKTVTATGLGLSGADARNYSVNTIATATASITARQLTVTATAQSRAYNGNTTASVTLSSNKVTDDELAIAFTSATFASSNIGSQTVTVSGISLDGPDADNYTLSNTSATATATITAKALTIANAAAGDKVYDRTTTATISGTLVGVIEGEDVSLTLSGTFMTPNVGTGIAVTSTSTLNGNAVGNYSLTQPTELRANITARELTVINAGADDKVYDGSRSATITGTLNGVLGNDNVTLTRRGTFASRDVGTHIVTSTSILDGTDRGNYLLTQPTGLAASISQRELTMTNARANDKVYNGNVAATITGTLIGIVNNDNVTFSQTGTFASPNVGTNIAVTYTGTLGGTEAHNYSLTPPTGLSANITARTLTVNNIMARDKVYDGTNDATINGTLTGIIPGDQVTWVGAGKFSAISNKYGAADVYRDNAGTVLPKPVTYSSSTLTGAQKGNYSFTPPTLSALSAKITPKELTPVVQTTYEKIYDGTTLFTTTAANLTGVISPDHVELYINSQSSVVTDGTQTLTLSIGSEDKDNYYLFPTSITVNVTITRRPLIITASGSTKVYDGNDNAQVNLSDNRVTGDVFTIAHSSAKYDSKHVGNNKPITVNGLSISGAVANNYTLSNLSASTTGSITPRSLTVTGLSADSKEYDATTQVHGFSGTATLNNKVQGDDISLTGSPVGTFSSKNAGMRTVTVTGFTKDGTDAGNYSLSQPTGLAAEITRRGVTGTFRAENKVYDGTATATVTTDSRVVVGKLGDDAVFLEGGTAEFTDATPGTDKVVTLTGAVLTGTDRGNYNLTGVATTLATIDPTPLPITLTSFTATAQKGGVSLAWTTAAEKDNDFFQVERSTDGRNFSTIGKVKGNGTSLVLQNYSFQDAATPAGTLYYRLKQVDFDGKFEYTKTIAVEKKAIAAANVTLKAYPNPTPDAVNLDLTQAAASDITIGVYGLNGRLVKTLTVTGGSIQKVDLSDVAVGTYLLRITGEGFQTTLRVLKH